MVRRNVWVFGLLSLTACAAGESMEWTPTGPEGTPDALDAPQDSPETAGMGAPEPGAKPADSKPADDGPASPSMPSSPADDVDNDPAIDEPDAVDEGPADASDPDTVPDMDTDASSDPDQAPVTPTAPTPTDPPATTPPPPMFTALADLEPSPNNIPECPATAPENPWGPCVGVPVYATCDYGTSPAPFYTCICDWIHWICVGFQ